jgi:hypothetical protein
MPHEEHQFSATNLETRFSHWRRPQASVTWAMISLGFAALGFTVYRITRKTEAFAA